MRRKSLDQMECSIAKALDVVGDPWTLLIVRDALFGVRRFEDFSRRLGIPRATLVARLAQLVDHGVLARHQYHESPTRFEYRITDKGRALRPVVITLMQWGDEWVRTDRPPVTLVAADGRTVTPQLVDADSRRPLDELGVRAVGSVADGIRRHDGQPSHGPTG